MNSNLVSESIALIRKAEKLSLAMQPDLGFHLAFSGGKDSQVLLELVRMAGVKYHAVYNVTTNDPAENVRFIREYYREVEFQIPKESFMQMVVRKGLPSMRNRWCCAVFKESSGVGSVVLTGVRREESRKREKYEVIGRWSSGKGDGRHVDIVKMEANEFRCVGGKDKFVVHPILEWTENDVWAFIKERGLPINPCYELKGRVGCVFCPYVRSGDIRKYCESHPRLALAFLHTIEKMMERRGDKCRMSSAEDYFEWWLSNERMSVFIAKRRQLNLFECSAPLGAPSSKSPQRSATQQARIELNEL